MTPLDKATRVVMAVYAATFAVAGLVFLLAPDRTAAQGEWIGSVDGTHFFAATTLGLMALLVANSVLVYRDPQRYHALLMALAISKVASSVSGGILALRFGEPGVWLVAVTDLPLAVIALVLWQRGRSP